MYKPGPTLCMRIMDYLRAAIVLTACLVLFSACATTQMETAPPTSEVLSADAIAGLEDIARTSADPSVRAQAYLRLARWHTSHANPDRNYPKALKEFELFVSLSPEKEVPGEVRDWIAALQELDRATEEIKKAKQRAGQLSKENKELKDALEKLKALDLKMEEKRKQVK